jgi:holliday junction DNA helicase RuvA
MIAFVNGQVTAAGPDGAVVDVGGVGLSVQCTPATLASLRVGDRAHVPTSLVVREDSLTLYGFADEDERSVFELLQTASGVGPRLALAMLAVHAPNALRRAVATEDLAALTKVPGIGKKGAQRIILELKDRLGGPIGDDGSGGAGAAAGGGASWRAQVHTGLVNLGWPGKDADAAVDAVAADLDGQETPDVGTLLKSALKKLSRP